MTMSGRRPGRPTSARQFRPQARDFDGLIDEGVLEAERGRLQRETLAGAARQYPMLAVVLLRNEDRNARRVEASCRAYFSFSASALKTRSNMIDPSQAGRTGLPVVALNRPSPVCDRLPRIEAQPGLQFPHEGRVGHLRAVAGDDQIADAVDLRPIRDQNQIDARHGRRGGERPQVGGADRLAVIVATGRLPLRDCVEHRGLGRQPAAEREHHGTVIRRVETEFARLAARAAGDGQVFRRATETGKQMVIVRIDDRDLPRHVGQDFDPAVA